MEKQSLADNSVKSGRRYWIALNQVPGMSPELFYKLTGFFGTPEYLWRADEPVLKSCGLLSDGILNAILNIRKKEDGSEEMERAEKEGAEIFIFPDDGYPGILKEVPAPPPVLYVKGKWVKEDAWSVAVVGSRGCTGYGRDAAQHLSRRLTEKGFTIISGLAHGIDAAAHRGALIAGGRTIAVFGTSIDNVYPAANVKLAGQIETSGALISEFPMYSKPEKWNFPRRNWIISGLSKGTIVVEAGEKSGALITAGAAVEQGRAIFAVPGDINTQMSKGPHWLLKNGAHLVESADDVIDILGSPKGQEELKLEERPENPVQAAVLEVVEKGPAGFDEICATCKVAVSEATAALMILELRGMVRQLPGKIYVKS